MLPLQFLIINFGHELVCVKKILLEQEIMATISGANASASVFHWFTRDNGAMIRRGPEIYDASIWESWSRKPMYWIFFFDIEDEQKDNT